MPQDEHKSNDYKIKKSQKQSASRDFRMRMDREDQVLLEELTRASGTTQAEAVRRAIAHEVERIREDRTRDRLDGLRSSLLSLQEQVSSMKIRIEAGIEVDRGIERSLLAKLEDIGTVSDNTWLNILAMIEVNPKKDEVRQKIQEIVSRNK